MKYREIFASHFETCVLVFIFVFGAVMLAFFPMKEELARWIEGGTVVGILARAFGTPKTDTKSTEQGKTE